MNFAFADENTPYCKFGTREQVLKYECSCTKYFKKVDVPKFLNVPKGHKLVAGCEFGDNRPDMKEHELSGSFLFEANAISEGVVDYNPGPAGDFAFSATKEGVGGWLESADSTIKEEAKLKAPPDSNRKDANRSICAAAKVKLRVKKYTVAYAGDTDHTGTHITDYDVISVGKYKFCSK